MELKLKAFVINLDRSPERLAHMKREFSRIGASFVRYPAIDGALLSEEERAEALGGHARAETWMPGDIGCFLSHLGVWKVIASGEDTTAAVFEDDIHVASDLQPLLASDNWIPAAADVIRLEANRKLLLSDGKRLAPASKRRVYRVHSDTWGSAGYILSKRAALRLMQASPDLRCPADFFLFMAARSAIAANLRRYQVVPAVCIQDGLLAPDQVKLPSTIDPTRKPTKLDQRLRPLRSLLAWKKRPVPFRQ